MTDTPTKKQKTANRFLPLFSSIVPATLTIDPALAGKGEGNKYAYMTLGARPVVQLATVDAPLRAPFGYDDGSKFGSKPSLKLELGAAQLEWVRGVEAQVVTAADKHKADWFPGVKPVPTTEAVRAGFSSRVYEDEASSYPPTLRVNLSLDAAKAPVQVSVLRRLPSGEYVGPTPGSIDDVGKGCLVVPVLQTAGGVWVKAKARASPPHTHPHPHAAASPRARRRRS